MLLGFIPALAFHSQPKASFSSTDNSAWVEQKHSAHIQAVDAALDACSPEQAGILLCISPKQLLPGQTRSLQEAHNQRSLPKAGAQAQIK